jgi:hypothetical protein
VSELAAIIGVAIAVGFLIAIPLASLKRTECQSVLEVTAKAEPKAGTTPATARIAVLSATDKYLFVRRVDNGEHHMLPRDAFTDARIVAVPDLGCILLQ